MAIWWLRGESGSGKTTVAKRMLTKNTVHLDGDEMRATICKDLGFSEEDRRENNLRIARLARLLSDKGFDVVVSTICPYEDLRQQIFWITKCRFLKIDGGYQHK
ncbi:unnamed protein product [marine sediment metagenome]|uniref:APS kinase domain-containing protein n=1 Tax=marine sediment metagenome TaxID=412755 RepID=X0V704_9ZZZZ